MKFYVAPMMDYTNRHFRTLLRLITRKGTLFTEMVVCNTLIHGKNTALALDADLDFEGPVVLQLGGCDPGQMEKASAIAKQWGFDNININVGCPSAKVSGKELCLGSPCPVVALCPHSILCPSLDLSSGAGSFGAVLMKDPHLVADLCIAASAATGNAPTVKCRIGVDNQDSYGHLSDFIDIVSRRGGVGHFFVHARSAILDKSFSPHDNRTIPPLQYDHVYSLVRDFPGVEFTLNGGVVSYEDMYTHTARGAHGVMVGRGVIEDPYLYRHVDRLCYGDDESGE